MLNLDFVDYEESLPKTSYCETNNKISEISLLEDKSYSDFFKEYICANKPCLVKNVADNWNSYTQWASDDKPNYKNLVSKFGFSTVPVSDCEISELNKQCKSTMLFKDYVDYLEKAAELRRDLLYLKDWHLKREYPAEKFYEVPKYFGSDWLNEYALDNNKDDFMFVYIGPKGSWTPFHADVYTSFSWSTNIVGKKAWYFFPPGEEMKIMDSVGNCPRDIRTHLNDNIKYNELIQNPGDAIFVPSGWFHQVHNEEDTISINHNWVNGANINCMWKSLKKNMDMVEKEIIEFKGTDGWEEHCQLMLRALFGLNYNDFLQFIKYICEKRLRYLTDGNDVRFEKWTFGTNHILFDLKSLKCVLNKLLNESYFDEPSLNEIQKNINSISDFV